MTSYHRVGSQMESKEEIIGEPTLISTLSLHMQCDQQPYTSANQLFRVLVTEPANVVSG